MDIALIPATSAGRELAWLMSLRAEPSSAEIQDHLELTDAVMIDIDAPGWSIQNRDLPGGLLAFGRLIRNLPGVARQIDDGTLCMELEQDSPTSTLRAVITVDHESSGKIILIRLGESPVDEPGELGRIRQLYDLAAGSYQQLAGRHAHYWSRARAWLRETCRDGDTVLDVGCGPGHLVADLPDSVRVIGCDVSPEMVRIATRTRPSGSFAVHDYHQPFPAQWPLAEVTVALGCLEFCADLPRAARNLAAATKPDGRLLLTVPRAVPLAPREVTISPPPPLGQITIHMWDDTEVESALAGAGLDLVTHNASPGFTSADIGTIEYGYWELKNTHR